MIYADAGTTYTKVIEDGKYYILPSKEFTLKPDKCCGHGGKCIGLSDANCEVENEIIALAKGALRHVAPDATVLDLGSRDAKWIKFRGGKFHDMDWNSSCASSTGATVEMLMKFYDLGVNDLAAVPDKFNVTCGIFGLEKIMDDVSNGGGNEMGVPMNATELAAQAVSKFIHGVAYNAWTFAKQPETLYLSGGFCENECFVKSLENYCNVVPLGRFVLCEGLIDE